MANRHETSDALVIGAGPAGLMAAERLAAAGFGVVVAEAKPSIGRKFLMAGKSGLNLTKVEPEAQFRAAYGAAASWLDPMLTAFGPQAVQDWARELGQEVFTGSTGRVFPQAMKASPLLRAWAARLAEAGVSLRPRWRWTGWDGALAQFETPEGAVGIRPGVTVLALGGASWARLGSDGRWAELLAARAVPLAPFLPANAGLSVAWSPQMARVFGAPVKGVALSAASRSLRGEFVVSRHGLEGGGIYALSSDVRDGAALWLDLLPDWSEDKILAGLERPQGKASLSTHLRKVLRLEPVKIALLQEFGRPLPDGPGLARLLKRLPIRHGGLRPMDEAISTAGGVSRAAVDAGLMLRACPGVFVAGEMLDWEAPTGGYLLTGCLATGAWAGSAAAAWCAARSPQ
ncbi:TIGR03862 family flavoprotein [Pseudoruegeria sp. SK021]|uniref:TIGR03862 family flavoprotein n=1 Tax=Pseudoruegeria sp. SK021 TaxID=1933035 RepID=UPI000A222015|nr:TIGR03862 family flavoprotein [Pseudoruegeria sp. SK021]OSP55064.1 NAD(FAD)-utilizing dehydrogenase [Pseudoruegeria sp. SK021]